MMKLENDKSLQRYLSEVQSGISRPDEEALQRFHENADHVVANIEKIQERLPEKDHPHFQKLQSTIEELKVQFSLGKMEGLDKLEEIEDRLNLRFLAIKKDLAQAKKYTQEETEDLNKILHEGWGKLQLEMIILYVRLDLAQETGVQKIADVKKEFIEDIKLITRLGKEEAQHVTEDFSAWVKRTQESVGEKGQRLLEKLRKHLGA